VRHAILILTVVGLPLSGNAGSRSCIEACKACLEHARANPQVLTSEEKVLCKRLSDIVGQCLARRSGISQCADELAKICQTNDPCGVWDDPK
jgi:hypothetical protein